jgi:hypothetical protein
MGVWSPYIDWLIDWFGSFWIKKLELSIIGDEFKDMRRISFDTHTIVDTHQHFDLMHKVWE